MAFNHRVHYRVPGFLSSRPNWVPQPPYPQGSVALSSLWVQGGDTLACGVGGGASNLPVAVMTPGLKGREVVGGGGGRGDGGEASNLPVTVVGPGPEGRRLGVGGGGGNLPLAVVAPSPQGRRLGILTYR